MTTTNLKKRLIPKLLINYKKIGSYLRPVLVTTKQYKEIYDIGDVVSQAKIYEAQLADELIILNISGTSLTEDAGMLKIIERLASETFMPLTVGGGVRSLNDFSLLLEHGADKISINSRAISEPDIISQAANRFGSQCVVVSIDFYQNSTEEALVYLKGSKLKKLSVLEWAKEVVNLGAGEIFLTDIDRDGTGLGLNCTIASKVVEAVAVPVILSGGCGSVQHFVEGFQKGGAEAIAAGTFFCFRDQNPMQLRAHLTNEGIPIRMNT